MIRDATLSTGVVVCDLCDATVELGGGKCMVNPESISVITCPAELSSVKVSAPPCVDKATGQQFPKAIDALEGVAALVMEWHSSVEVAKHEPHGMKLVRYDFEALENWPLALTLRKVAP